MTPIDIDFQAFSYVVIGLFALVGFTRGWLREALTTILLTFLVLMIAKPEIATKIMTISTAVMVVVAKLVLTPFMDPIKVAEIVTDIKDLFDIENPYGFMLALTIVLIFISYTIGKRALTESKLTPLSRLLGGTLGAISGFVVLSLARQYLLTKLGFTTAGGLSPMGSVSAAQAPQSLSVNVKNLSTSFQISEVVLALLLAVGVIVLVFFVREVSSRQAAGKKK